MKKTVWLMLVLVLNLFFVFPSKSIVLDNVYVYVDKIDVFLNGSYLRQSAFGVRVELMNLVSGFNQTRYTDMMGLAVFSANETGAYKLNCLLAEHFYEPRNVYINISTVNTFNEVILKTGVFLYQSQITVFRELRLYLPCVFSLNFPESTDINFTVESYGLRTTIDKGSDYFTFTPQDSSDIVIISNQTLFSPNYTLYLSFKTLREGAIFLRIVSEGKFLANVAPLYFVPKEATVMITVTIHVSKPTVEDTVEKIDAKLDVILQMLSNIQDVLINVLVPNVTKWDKIFNNFVSSYFGNISLSEIVMRLSTMATGVDSFRSDFFIFKNTVAIDISDSLAIFLSDFKNTTYLMVGIVVLLLLAVGMQFYKKKEKANKKVSTGLVTGVGV